MAAPQDTLPLGSLTAEQLEGIQKTTDQEVQFLVDQIRQLNGAHQRLNASKRCAKDFEQRKDGEDIMVPLTTSVYVCGQLGDTSKVLVDLGTGYFTERAPAEAEQYFQRRATLVKEQIDKAQSALNQKRQMHEAVTQVLRRKVMEGQATAAAQTGQTGTSS